MDFPAWCKNMAQIDVWGLPWFRFLARLLVATAFCLFLMPGAALWGIPVVSLAVALALAAIELHHGPRRQARPLPPSGTVRRFPGSGEGPADANGGGVPVVPPVPVLPMRDAVNLPVEVAD